MQGEAGSNAQTLAGGFPHHQMPSQERILSPLRHEGSSLNTYYKPVVLGAPPQGADVFVLMMLKSSTGTCTHTHLPLPIF